MKITKTQTGNSLVVALSGRLDTITAPVLEADLKDSLDGIQDLVLDFEELQYISSAGLRVLLSTQKQMSKQGGLTLRNVSSDVMEIFEVTGFSSILTIQ